MDPLIEEGKKRRKENNERNNERTNEQTNERTNERTKMKLAPCQNAQADWGKGGN